MTEKIRVAIVGVGNCASSLLQGLEYYRNRKPGEVAGLMHPDVGGYSGLLRLDLTDFPGGPDAAPKQLSRASERCWP